MVILSGLLLLFETILLYHLADSTLTRKNNIFLAIALSLLLNLVRSAGFHFWSLEENYLAYCIAFSIDFTLIYTFFRGAFFRKVLVVLLFYLLLFISDHLIIFLFQKYLGWALDSIHLSYYLILAAIISRLFAMVRILLASNFLQKLGGNPLQRYWWVVLISAITVGIVLVLPIQDSQSLIAFISGYMLLVILLMFILSSTQSKSLMLQNHLAYINEHLRLQKNHFEEVNQQYKLIARLTHNFHAHTQYLVSCIEANNYIEANRYIQQMQETFSVVEKYTGNVGVDAIIAAKYQRMKQQNIELNVLGSLPAEIPFEPFQLNLLISNALENAREACLLVKEKPKIIEVDFVYNAGLLFTVKNPVHPQMLEHARQLNSTKGIPGHGGIGIETMRAVARRYNGYLETLVESGFFTLNVLLQELDGQDKEFRL